MPKYKVVPPSDVVAESQMILLKRIRANLDVMVGAFEVNDVAVAGRAAFDIVALLDGRATRSGMSAFGMILVLMDDETTSALAEGKTPEVTALAAASDDKWRNAMREYGFLTDEEYDDNEGEN